MNPSGADALNELCSALLAIRAQLGIGADDVAETLYEHWFKREHWRARSEAIPLLVGCAPATWAAHCQPEATGAAAEVLWRDLASAIPCDEQADPDISPFELRRWAQRHALALPAALNRLLDFIGTVLPTRAISDDTPGAAAANEDRVHVLGAALSLVTSRPERCVDDAGCYDAARIVAQMFRQAIYWFPLGPPTLSEAEAVQLVARWLPTPAGT